MRTKKNFYQLVPNDRLEIYFKDELVLTISSKVACSFSIKDFVVLEDYLFKHITE